MALITLEEAKKYLRVDYSDEDGLIGSLISAAAKLVQDVTRQSDEEFSVNESNGAVMYAVAYLYEHREEADHHDLMLTLRSLLFGIRKEGF